MENCFDNDFVIGRYPGFIKDKKDIKATKEVLKRLYREIKQVFKYFSSYSGMEKIMCIGENMIASIAHKMNIGEGNPEYVNEVLLIFKNSCFTDKKFSFYQKGNLARFQWLEFVARLAHKKYIETKVVTTCSEAIELLYGRFLSYLEQFFKEFSSHYDDNGWKETVYWCEEMDELYTKYFKVIEYLFKRYSGLKTKPGQKPFMSLEEYRNLIFDFGLDKLFPNTEIPLCFNQAMMSQIDEVDSERCSEMSQVEFMEAFARLADQISFPHISAPDQTKKPGQKLWTKTEALLRKIADDMPKKIISQIALPKESLFDQNENLFDLY